MSFLLETVLELGNVDRALIDTRRRLEAAPRLASPQRARVADAKAELSRLQDAAKHAKLEVKRLEGEAEAKQGEITKAQVALNTVKNNEEYQVLLRTIATRKEELSGIETQILEAYEADDARGAALKACRQRLASQEQELKSAEARVAEEEARQRTRIAELESEREGARGAVGQQHLALYQRILDKKGDTAVAEVVDEMCQGCFIRVRPEQVSQIRGRQELVTCFNCGRIMYYGG